MLNQSLTMAEAFAVHKAKLEKRFDELKEALANNNNLESCEPKKKAVMEAFDAAMHFKESWASASSPWS